ncbi:acyl-CoA thioesterase [Bacillus sp. EAC]|uniref:acyl-CoA thioesterase n=1 Tax=Bacillus sp. EAC TaxID=1978338 RepID=UPI000B454473
MSSKYCHESRSTLTIRVFPTDLNNHRTLFGGKILADMDMTASITASRHARLKCVTASIDHVDFLHPVTEEDCISYESFIVLTGRSSMVIFVKAIAENLITGDRRVAATSFLTFVGMMNDKTVSVPSIILETDEERELAEIAKARLENRKNNKLISKNIENIISTKPLTLRQNEE